MPLVSAIVLALLFAPQEKPAATCAISGNVVDAGTGIPLGKVVLLAERIDGGNAPASSTTTDLKGNFDMAGLPAGTYRLKGVRNGYLSTYYGARKSGATGTTIKLEAGQELKNVQVRLLPFGVISGSVLDSDGEPISGAEVTVMRREYFRPGGPVFPPVAQTRTDDLGHYRIANLPAGRYLVLAEPVNEGNAYGFRQPVDRSKNPPTQPTALLPTLYPGVFDPAGARLVEIPLGARVGGIDIPLVRSPVYRVAGRATSPTGQVRYVDLEFPQELGANHLSARGIGPGGEFELTGVPPGSYKIRARVEPRQESPATTLLVNGNVEGMRLVAGKGSEVKGRVTIEGKDPGKPGTLYIHFTDEKGKGPAAEVGSDNAFQTILPPGRYSVELWEESPGMYIKSARSGSIDVFEDGLTVTENARINVDIVVTFEGGQVDGVVLDKDDKPVPGATVVLVAPLARRNRNDSFHAYTSDQYGRFHFESIRPGDYKLFAWDDVENNAWFDPDFLKAFEDKGEPVTVTDNGQQTSRVHLIAP